MDDRSDHDVLLVVETTLKETDRKVSKIFSAIELMKERCVNHELRLASNESDAKHLIFKIREHEGSHVKTDAKVFAVAMCMASAAATIIATIINCYL